VQTFKTDMDFNKESTSMSFQITGLSPEPFTHLYGQTDAELASLGVLRYHAKSGDLFPDRIEMREAKPGETLLLLNHTCQPANSPYQAKHAIFVREGATAPYVSTNEIPEVMQTRLLSLRGFDAAGMMQEGEVVDGQEIRPMIEQIFANPDVDYIHVHNARRGCYSGRIDRV
jgi:hypothetical protein